MINESVSIFEVLSIGFQTIASQVLVYLPKVVAAVAVLLIGWLSAWVVRLLLVRAIARFDELWHRLMSTSGDASVPSRYSPTRVVGELVFWLLMFIFASFAAEILGIDVFGVWLKDIFSYLLMAAAGLFIVLVGYVLSSLVRDLILSAAYSADLSHGDLLANVVQIIILVIAIILGIDQVGIDTLFLSVFVGIILATMLGGLALAFSLGARTHVSNIIAANQLRQLYQPGDKIRIGDVEGRVREITMARVIIETESSRVDVPAKLFDESVITIIEKSD